jgi:hypothetical protein
MHSQQMALIMLSVMGFIDYLGYGTFFTHAMFCSVVAGRTKVDFYSCQKANDVCWDWEVVR